MESVVKAALYLGGVLIGIVLHWSVQWAQGNVRCLLDMLLTETRRTVAAMLTQVLSSIGMLATGAVDALPHVAALFAGVMQGGAIDALVNRGKRKRR